MIYPILHKLRIVILVLPTVITENIFLIKLPYVAVIVDSHAVKEFSTGYPISLNAR